MELSFISTGELQGQQFLKVVGENPEEDLLLSEEERVEVRALRERAIQFQHERQRLHQNLSQCRVCHHQLDNQQRTWNCHGCNNINERHSSSSSSKKTSDVCRTHSGTPVLPSVTHCRQREGQETSSSSGPSSGGEPMSEGPEDSPSAANVSVQTESSVSFTASTDLRSYLNTSLDNSLDTSISACNDTWHHSSSLTDVDEALLLSASPEVATNLILGRLHPSAVLHPSTKIRPSQADSQHTETASTTLVQGRQSLERLAASENHDTTTTASLSLSFASVSEEGGEGSGDGLEVSEEILEVSEEAIDGSEEDRAGSLPSEVESDSHKEEDNHRQTSLFTSQRRNPKTTTGDVGKSVREGGTSTGVREVREVRDAREPSWMLQRDSGRSSSHSDYLDDYLELLTSRCGSGLGLETNVLSVTMCKASAPVTTTSTTTSSKIMSTSTSETYNGSIATAVGANNGDKQKEKKNEDVEASHEKVVHKGKDVEKTDTHENGKRIRSPRELQRARDVLGEPRSLSATSERRVSRKSRARRWSSAQSLDPGRSVGSKYLDSYLGNLTDDAWLQYPTQLTSRRMVFLDSDEYIHSVRPHGVRKLQEDSSRTRYHSLSESSASEDSKKHDSYVTSSDDPLSNIHGKSDSSEDWSKDPSSRDNKRGTINQLSAREDQPNIPQATSQAPQQNLGPDSKNIPTNVFSNQSTQPIQESTDLSFEIHNVQENILHEAPETPSDRTETKVSSDEGIELLGSPASTGSDVKIVIDGNGSKSSSKEEISIVEEEIEVNPPSPSHSAEVATKEQDKSGVEDMVPEFKFGGVVGCAENNEERQDSSSEDSSETEPSTIVYVEDCSIDSLSLSLSEGQKNSLVESEGKSKSQIDLKAHSNTQIGNKEQSSWQEDGKGPGSEVEESGGVTLGETGTVLVHEEKTSPRKDSERIYNKLPEQSPLKSVQLVKASKYAEVINESDTRRNPVTGEQRLPNNDQGKKGIAEYDIYDSEDECLVVQVYEDQSIISHSGVRREMSELGRDSSADSDYVEEVVKIVPQRRDRMKNDVDTSCVVELVPYRDSEDAMGQVLTLLRAKQQQELEELRVRQEEEVRQFIKQLQNVSPEHLHAFLAASHASGSGESSSSGDGPSYVLSQTALKTKTVVRPSIENDDSRNVNRQQRSNMNIASFSEASVYSDSDDIVVSSSEIPVLSIENLEQIPSVIPSQPGQAREWNSQSSSSSSSTTHPLVVTLPCPSTHLPILTFPPATTHPPTTVDKAEVESPKPRPSNHTNLMPSYIMNEEMRKSTGHQENDNYMQLDLDLRTVSPKHPSTQSPHHIPISGTSMDESGSSSVEYSHARNNNADADDSLSFINGNCVNYGDGMQYYRLCTPDEDLSISEITPRTTEVETHYQSKPTETVTQPGLFKVMNNGPWPGPRPTSITSLLAEHPEIFREDIVEVNLEHAGDWGTSTVGLRDPCRTVVDECSMTREAAATAEGGLDMVPERESAASVHFLRLSQNVIFVRGIVLLQACVRRYMTQRLLRTKFVQEQLATLAEIAKLAQQFHCDILTDNIHKGDVDFHKALYNQEGLARERIRRVFFVLSVQEQMSLICRDRQLWQMEQERQTSTILRPSPTHSNSSKPKSRNVEDRPRSGIASKTPAAKRPSPTAPRPQQEVKARAGSLRSRTSRLVQPSHAHHLSPSHNVNMSNVHTDHKVSSRSKLPVQMERSTSHVDSAPSHYTKTSHVKSPQDTRSGLLPSNRCASHPRSSSTSQIPSRTSSRQSSRASGHVASVNRSMSCSSRSTTHSNSPRRAHQVGHAPPLAFATTRGGMDRQHHQGRPPRHP
ncbi:serine-rich adhesin for platelets-like isoform X1 [Homarus americanus]|uniref:serine-rich adhesin for platelets-like isoform X1 n=1 Tax=Homarus americanus TaxID=6706 RepID=UPI001C46BBEF|nr:serine-rich adhesin for platelets-like isoform X1 [Homarus americanus]